MTSPTLFVDWNRRVRLPGVTVGEIYEVDPNRVLGCPIGARFIGTDHEDVTLPVVLIGTGNDVAYVVVDRGSAA